jgi:parallel beta-helix repeat protein
MTGKTASQVGGLVEGVTVPNKEFFDDQIFQRLVEFVNTLEADRRSVYDYGAVGDSTTEDGSSMQDAIDAIAANGGLITIPPGKYLMTDSELQLRSRQTLQGVLGASKLELDKTAALPTSQGVSVGQDSVRLVVIKGLEIDGNASDAAAYSQHDHGIEIWNGSTAGRGKYVLIEDCYIHSVSGDGIYVHGYDWVIINRCFIEVDSLDTSEAQGRNGIAVVEGDNIIITNNIIYGGFPAAIDIEPNASDSTNNLLIADNVITKTFGYGISLNASQSNAGADRNVITNNTILNSTDAGIRVQDTDNFLIADNKVFAGQSIGINIRSNNHEGIIRDNEVSNNDQHGILIGEDCTNILVEGNTSYENTGAGIRVAGSSGHELRYITVKDNVCRDNDSGDSDTHSGIHINYMNKSYVNNNFCYDSQSSATQMYGFDITQCDSIFIGLQNTGFDNKTRLMKTAALTAVTRGMSASYAFSDTNTAISQTNVAIPFSGSSDVDEGLELPYDGQIVGITASANANPSAGTATLRPAINGIPKALTVVLQNGSQLGHNFDIGNDANLAFTADDTLRALITTDGSWSPTTNDVTVTILVRY